jgi:hypothetical protein
MRGCLVSVVFLKSEQAPCVALEVAPDGRMLCGMILHPTRYFSPNWREMPDAMREIMDAGARPSIEYLLAVGDGCTMSDDREAVVERLEAKRA